MSEVGDKARAADKKVVFEREVMGSRPRYHPTSLVGGKGNTLNPNPEYQKMSQVPTNT